MKDIQTVTLGNNIRDPVLKYIAKYRNHPSILAIGESTMKTEDYLFPFQKHKDTKTLSDIKVENFKRLLVKQNADIFANALVSNFNDSVEKNNPY